MDFYTIVLTAASTVLLLILIVVGVTIQQSKDQTPALAAPCPDGFVATAAVANDGTTSYTCTVPGNLYDGIGGTSNTANLTKFRTFGNGQTAQLNYTDAARTSSTINFTNSMWSGDTGACNKYLWATSNQYGTVNWDGITNRPNPCTK